MERGWPFFLDVEMKPCILLCIMSQRWQEVFSIRLRKALVSLLLSSNALFGSTSSPPKGLSVDKRVIAVRTALATKDLSQIGLSSKQTSKEPIEIVQWVNWGNWATGRIGQTGQIGPTGETGGIFKDLGLWPVLPPTLPSSRNRFSF